MGLDISGLGSAFDFAKTITNKVWPPGADPNKKLEVAAIIEADINARENTLINVQKSIIVAEMQQGDNYTKRARPSVVYTGLLFIGLVHVLFPIAIGLISIFYIGEMTAEQINQMAELKEISLPTAFWTAWGAVTSIWSVGRTLEKKGLGNRLTKLISG
jgi:hypothetical protein